MANLAAMNGFTRWAQDAAGRLARAWMRRFPQFSLRIASVIIFAGLIVFTTRAPSSSVSLNAQRGANELAAPARPVEAKPLGYSWLSPKAMSKTTPLVERLATPEGFTRVDAPSRSFADWLRRLPTWPEGTAVTTARRQVVMAADDPRLAAVIALQPGSAKVLDAANMLIRLRGEYCWSAEAMQDLAFHFTSGHASEWRVWAAGGRPSVKGRQVQFKQERPADSSRESFCSYLETVFQYSSPYSIFDDTDAVRDGSVGAGDIFINPAPRKGYAVIVLDVSSNPQGKVKVLLGTGGAPPQTFHVLRASDGTPWFDVTQAGIVAPQNGEPLRMKDQRRWRN